MNSAFSLFLALAFKNSGPGRGRQGGLVSIVTLVLSPLVLPVRRGLRRLLGRAG